MVHNDNLSLEPFGISSWDVGSIGSNVTSLDILDRETLNIETNIVTGNSFSNLLVMHLDGLALSGSTVRSEADVHSWLDDTSFNSTDWDSSDTRDLVDIL